MNYIILDLEWDGVFAKKHQRFVNQILQIGAVKLDESLNIIDTFEVTVCSSLSKKVSGRFQKLTGITSEMMLAGIPFEDAVKNYNEWVGTDTVTLTWSTSDLFTIFDNEKFLLEGIRFNIEKYMDLQKFIQNEMRLAGEECKNQISLSDAAEYFKISTESFDLHTAKDDSLLSVALLQKTYYKERFETFIRDTRDPDFYKRLFYKPQYINDLSDPQIDKKQLKVMCSICGMELKRTGKWRYRNRWFVAPFFCKNCNKEFSGRISFKKNFDNIVVRKRVVEPPERKEKSNEMQPVSTQV